MIKMKKAIYYKNQVNITMPSQLKEQKKMQHNKKEFLLLLRLELSKILNN